MELNETIEMMNSKDYQERYKAEYYQLKIRHDKLAAMLKNHKAGKLNFTPSCSCELLSTQLVYMECYMNTLEERARIEKVKLKADENDSILVSKEDCLARDNGDNTLTPYEVVCADENVFVIAPVSLNDDDSCTTDYQQLEAYSNDKSINSLESLGFIKIDD